MKKPRIPVPKPGEAILLRPNSSAQSKLLLVADLILSVSVTKSVPMTAAWITNLAFSLPL